MGSTPVEKRRGFNDLNECQKRKAKRGLCVTEKCKNRPDKSRKRWRCKTCLWREWIAKYPVRHCYHQIKKSAKKRGKTFTLTFEHFSKVCAESGYVDGRGRHSHQLTINRRDDAKGYEDGNIEVVTGAENIAQEHERRKMRRTLFVPFYQNHNCRHDESEFHEEEGQDYEGREDC